MAQRILEPGQIETLARASIPRIRLPDRASVFAHRAARLRELAPDAAIGDYLRFLAVLVEAQHTALAELAVSPPAPAEIARSLEYGMPPLHPSTWTRPAKWRDTLETLCVALAAQAGFPAGVNDSISTLRRAEPAWIEAQATSILQAHNDSIDAALAPLLMAALQVYWVALSSRFLAEEVRILETAGLCPLCGSLPVASLVCAQSPYQGYRYLHCALCATEWHMVRVQCSSCGAMGKDIAYHSLKSNTADKVETEEAGAAVRAETCEQCRGYRKILYQEKDPSVEPVADDVASLALDVLLADEGYHRANSNPLLWLRNAT